MFLKEKEAEPGTIHFFSPTRLLPSPRDAVHAPIAVRRHLAEQGGAEIDVVGGAAVAGVDDGGPMSLARGRVEDVDGGAAFGVGVGVGGVVHHGDGQSDDVVAVVALDPARSHPRAVPGDVAHVPESGPAKDEERKKKERWIHMSFFYGFGLGLGGFFGCWKWCGFGTLVGLLGDVNFLNLCFFALGNSFSCNGARLVFLYLDPAFDMDRLTAFIVFS